MSVKQSTREAVERNLSEGLAVRRRLPGGGLLQIDRPLPAIIVYRKRADQIDEATEKLLASATSALVAGVEDDITEMVDTVVGTEAEAFGKCLTLEIWAGPEPESDPGPDSLPRFVIYGPEREDLIPLVESLQNELCGTELEGGPFDVVVRRGPPPAPPGMQPLLSESRAQTLGTILFGLEIPPVYRNPSTGEAWPLILRKFRRDLTQVFRRWIYGFLHDWTTLRPACHNEIGSHSIVPVVWSIDEQLAAVADSFDFLLQVTPVNAAEAWQSFKESKYEKAPVLQYRPVPVEPTLLKRRLYAVPIEKIDDPALCRLFREKQEELDRKITLIMDRNTPRFVHGSIQLFGAVDDEFYGFAREMLENLPPVPKEKKEEPMLDARAFAALAEAEIASFRKQLPEVDSTVQIREDMYTGLMVSRGSVLIGANLSIPASRAEALVQHEVGTHVLTYWNGRAQPFRQLYSGLAGYDALQEGIAVLAEAFVGELSRDRKRLLLGRVVAVRLMVDGATFVETFRELHHTWGFPARTAFTITLRVYRGGGLTKDAVYVRGIGELLDYLRGGGKLESLLLGKFAVEHVPLVQELMARKILVPPPIRPGYFDSPHMALIMEKIHSGQTLFQILRDKTMQKR
ncbi:MAG TPA: DUF1704 domain-containing protein [Candidatus Melainabacteria bacterium]|nr:DUF1704 domain-containing protein [Candidatus Melainabacteria bacterium]